MVKEIRVDEFDYCPQHGYSLPCPKCGMGKYEQGFNDGYKKGVEDCKRAHCGGCRNCVIRESECDKVVFYCLLTNYDIESVYGARPIWCPFTNMNMESEDEDKDERE